MDFSNWTDCQRNQYQPKSLLILLPSRIGLENKKTDIHFWETWLGMLADTHWPSYDNLAGYDDYLNFKGAIKKEVTMSKKAWKTSIAKTNRRKIIIVKNVKQYILKKEQWRFSNWR
ncbi:hypothetical protein NZD88_00770 [Chryseobacterium antibioticum]|uniref:Uncharacterized protein n=1 Tax=Chryseobacterium pyrolae TaxID=2987481 RepID=A0ABT2IBT5_9FLAO|nr:hypothetical protein [Chryseobacterium pyrolae]MCT2406084.1 hypothetical protein [Chryseobacterium pyrolae]